MTYHDFTVVDVTVKDDATRSRGRKVKEGEDQQPPWSGRGSYHGLLGSLTLPSFLCGCSDSHAI